ncbi:uncharacterized protein LOC141591498 [Silene latifolia]|uniref:uncharacterized protein LOC141591498 n=1 Tax=Silene latifolia TaxID=37657 RepID=UPI003D770D64
MVFSSVPLYLDPPNWQQHPNQQVQQQQVCHNNSNQHEQNHQHQLIPLPSSQVPQPQQMGMLNGIGGGGVGGGGSVGPGAQQIRANSMSERARLAKIPPPEVPLKCPRCESNNTKFCYYNNYSLTQPRHFCKTCRRYWTRGGALRNVPVGGGCRRNKRTSSNNSNNKTSSGGGGGGGAMSAKSGLSLTPQSTMVNGDHHLVSDSRGINVNSLSGSGNGMSFMASLQNIAQLGGMSNNMMSNIAQLAFSPNSNTTPLGGVGSGVGAGVGYNLGFPQQQQQQQVQFPNFLGGFEIPGSSEGTGGLYSTLFQNIHHHRHHNGNNNNNNGQVIDDGNEVEEHQPQELLNVNNMSKSCSSTSMITPVKMEDNNNGQQGLNLAKQLMMGISSSTDNNHNNILSRNINNSNSNSNNNMFWGGNMMTNGAAVTSMWTDLSGLNSSSTTHLL